MTVQNTANSEGSGVTALTAVNIAKGLTVFCLFACVFLFGVRDMRQVIYLCLHISYGVWWQLEQWIYPERRQMYGQKIGWLAFIYIIVSVGIFYALPGYLAFTNPEPLSLTAVTIALPLYIFGSLINTSADVQKLTAKQFGAGLVRDNIWRFSRNINYFGDLVRYISFCVVAGSPWAYLVPGYIAIFYAVRMREKEQGMAGKYPEYGDYQKSTARFIPFVW